MDNRNVCCARLRSFYAYCGRVAKHEYKGKWYCGTHYPPAREEKYRKADEARAEERKVRREAERRELLKRDILGRVFREACLKMPELLMDVAKGSHHFKPGDELLVRGFFDNAVPGKEN